MPFGKEKESTEEYDMDMMDMEDEEELEMDEELDGDMSEEGPADDSEMGPLVDYSDDDLIAELQARGILEETGEESEEGEEMMDEEY